MRQPHHSFRFNNAWLLEPSLIQLVKDNWSQYPSSSIISKLSYCIEDINSWSKNISPNFRHQINKQRAQLEDICNSSRDAIDPRVEDMQKNLANLLLQEDTYWRQRAKVYWLADGDTNSKFFHASASARKRRNTIKKLRDPSGNWIVAHDELCSLVRNYFTNIFTSQQGDHHPIISCVQPRVSIEENNILTAPFTESEFKDSF